MFKVTEPQIDLEEAIIRAVRHLNGSEGASLSDIELYVLPILNERPDSESIQLCANIAVEKGLMMKLANGNYKIQEITVEDRVEEAIQEASLDEDLANARKIQNGVKRSPYTQR